MSGDRAALLADTRVYIGIDPATACGWAALVPEYGLTHYGTWRLQRRAGDGAGMLYVRFERLFCELLDLYREPIVAYEQQANRFAGSAHVGLGIMAHLQRICEQRAVPYTGIAFSAVKKHATGKGNADKAAMIAAAESKWRISGLDDNAADALWIADALRAGVA